MAIKQQSWVVMMQRRVCHGDPYLFQGTSSHPQHLCEEAGYLNEVMEVAQSCLGSMIVHRYLPIPEARLLYQTLGTARPHNTVQSEPYLHLGFPEHKALIKAQRVPVNLMGCIHRTLASLGPQVQQWRQR